MTKTKRQILERIRDMPDDRAHPLRLFLVRRGVTLEEAARAFGWSLRKIKGVIVRSYYPRDPDLAELAEALGFSDVEALFPRIDGAKTARTKKTAAKKRSKRAA